MAKAGGVGVFGIVATTVGLLLSLGGVAWGIVANTAAEVDGLRAADSALRDAHNQDCTDIRTQLLTGVASGVAEVKAINERITSMEKIMVRSEAAQKERFDLVLDEVRSLRGSGFKPGK